MIRALFTAATGMQAQQLNVDVIAHNLANVNTTGFKRGRADFQDLLYQNLRQAGAASSNQSEIPTGIQLGLGTRAAAVQRLSSWQGELQHTQNQLDMAIDGDGFFQILHPNGDVVYSRAGAFKLDSQGRVVTSDGYPLEPEITIPNNATGITVGSDGTMSVLQPGNATHNRSARYGWSILPIPLDCWGWAAICSKPPPPLERQSREPLVPQGLGSLSQGFLEISNVSVVEEMVNLITGQRAYEINSRAIQAADEMLQTTTNLRR